ncbi:MAG: response regulator [Prochlorotrichaceae cyanobacterium]
MASDSTPNAQAMKVLIVDDHDLILQGTANLIAIHHPQTHLLFSQTAQETHQVIARHHPKMMILDLCLPERGGMPARIDVGLDLLAKIMVDCPNLNIMVQSSYPQVLIRLRHEIENHQGGFTIVDKVSPSEELLKFIDWTMQGIAHTKNLNSTLEVRPEWLEVLYLAFHEGLQDQAIADRMQRSLRMIRRYWTKIQDALGVYPNEDQNIRVVTLKRAREEGLID